MLATTLVRRAVLGRSRLITTVSKIYGADDPTVITPATELTADEASIRDMVRAWAAAEVLPRARAMDTAGVMDPVLIESMHAHGLLGIEVEERHGGCGASFSAALLCVEEIAYQDPSVAVLVDIQNTLVNNMFRFWASDALKEEWLPRLATDTVSSFCLSEASSGSDAFALRTTATKSSDGSQYVLDGEKMWISNAQHAGVFVVMATVDTSAGHRGITCFVVDANTPGVSLGAPERKLGIRASSTCSVRFDGAAVPASAVLGDVGKGYKYAIEILNEGRIGIGAQLVGLARGCFDHTMPYLMAREQFGRPVADFQGLEHQYAQIASEIECVRAFTYNAARLKERGQPFVKEAAMVKLLSSQIAEKTASKCVEWLGGVGFTEAHLAEKFYRDAKIGSIYEGTSNIQMNTIARLVKANFRP